MVSLLDLPNEILEHVVEEVLNLGMAGIKSASIGDRTLTPAYTAPYDTAKTKAAIVLRQTHSRFVELVDPHVFREVCLRISPQYSSDSHNSLWESLCHPSVKKHAQTVALRIDNSGKGYPSTATRGALIQACRDTVEEIAQASEASGSSGAHFESLHTLEALDTGGLLLLPFVFQLAPSVVHINVSIEDDEFGLYLDELNAAINRNGCSSASIQLPQQTVPLLTIEQFGANDALVDLFNTWPLQPIQLSLPFDVSKWEGGVHSWSDMSSVTRHLASWPVFKRFEMLAGDEGMGCMNIRELILDLLYEHHHFIEMLEEEWAGRRIRMKMHVLVREWQEILRAYGRETELDEVLHVVKCITVASLSTTAPSSNGLDAMVALRDLPDEILERIADCTVLQENYLDARFRAAATLKLVHTRFIASTDAHIFRSIYLHASAATFDGYNLFWDRLTQPAVMMHLRDLSLEVGLCEWPKKKVPDLADLMAEREVLIEGIFDTVERIEDLLLDGEVPGEGDFDPFETPLTAGRFMKLHSISVTDFAFTLLLPHLVSLAPWLQEVHISQESLPYTKYELSEALDTLERFKEPTSQPGKRIRVLEITHFGSSWITRFLKYWRIHPERLTLVSSRDLWEGRTEDYLEAILKVADWTGFEAFDLLQSQEKPVSATWQVRQRFAESLGKEWAGRRIKMQVQVHMRDPELQFEDEANGELLQRHEMLEFTT